MFFRGCYWLWWRAVHRAATAARINELTADVTTLEDELETTKAALAKAGTDLETAQTQLTTARLERDTARTRLATVQADLTMTEEDLEDAEADLQIANSALSTARSALTAAETQVTTLTTQLATATGRVTTLTGQLTSAQSENTSLESQVEQAETELTEAEQENLRARVTAYLDNTDGVLVIGDGDRKTATVMWMRGGSLQFMPEGAYTSTSAPSVPGSWSRRGGFTSRSGDQTNLRRDTAYLYSNIQSPGTRAWWKVHGLADELTMNADLQKLARGSSARPNADTVPLDVNNNATIGHQYDMLTVSGSLGGVSGRFTCSGCGGTVGSNTDGIDADVTFVQGRPTFDAVANWTFERTGSVTSGYQMDQDDAFLYFGIWASEPDDVSGDPMFRYIAGGGALSGPLLTQFGALTGTATFTGGAIGKYATQGQVGQQNASIGTFTATATLTADFDANNNSGTLHGRITNFRDNGTPLAGWSVTLGLPTSVGTPANLSSASTTGDTVASLGGVPAGGEWGATFHGSHNAVIPEADRVLYPATRYPVVDLAGVTGWFNATSDTAGIAGAFAATP